MAIGLSWTINEPVNLIDWIGMYELGTLNQGFVANFIMF